MAKFGIGIDNVINAQKGKVVIGCTKKEESTKLAEELRNKSEIIISLEYLTRNCLNFKS